MTTNKRRWILDQIIGLANRLETRWFPQPVPKAVGGKFLRFVPRGTNLGRMIYRVDSVRGDFVMGWVEWSNQWNEPRFKPNDEAVFNRQCIAEIYACMREMK